jgi:hypothetical protein
MFENLDKGLGKTGKKAEKPKAVEYYRNEGEKNALLGIFEGLASGLFKEEIYFSPTGEKRVKILNEKGKIIFDDYLDDFLIYKKDTDMLRELKLLEEDKKGH